MKYLLTVFVLAASFVAKSQSVLVMDFVKIKNGKNAEAMFYYENNWKKYRELALEKGFISSYRLERTTADSVAAFDLVLITGYPDSAAYKKSEENFRGILSALRPNGPVLLNEIKPADFRQSVFAKVTETIWSNSKTQ